jgi:flagellar basal body-associated protein FliL
MPQTGSAYPPAPGTEQPQKKKSKAGLVIGIVIAIVLVICVGLGIGGFLLWQNLNDITLSNFNNTPTPSTNDTPRPNNNTPTPSPNETPAPNNNDTPVTPAADEEVIVDTDILTFTFDAGSGGRDDVLDWYSVDCTVVNKTDVLINIYFDYDTVTDNGVSGENIVIFPTGNSFDFSANTTTRGILAIMAPYGEPIPDGIQNLRGTLIVFDANTYETIVEYPVSIDAM